jgi:hypothetical protein
MFSFGKSSRNALTTVSPPMPESNTPIGFIYGLRNRRKRAFSRKVAVRCGRCKLKWRRRANLRRRKSLTLWSYCYGTQTYKSVSPAELYSAELGQRRSRWKRRQRTACPLGAQANGLCSVSSTPDTAATIRIASETLALLYRDGRVAENLRSENS